MINLKECNCEKTSATKKLNVKGKIENLPVYKIPLENLYYNSKNDRIATWISKYNADNEVNIDNLSKEELNKVIEEFIIQSDEKAFKKTKNNIKALSQLEPGVVFSDGRVIDGNRRYTCLRSLYSESGDPKFGYFEAVILDNTVSDKEIKIMELELQHGKEEKIDYNPIEKLVGIYKDVVRDKVLTVEEYARSVDKTPSEIRKSVATSEILVDFLEYINAPEQFYIARELVLDGPINEAYRVKSSLHDEEKWENAKLVLYDNILVKTSKPGDKDTTRFIRSIGDDIIKNDKVFDDYFEQHMEYSEAINNIVESTDMVTTQFINEKIRGNVKLRNEMNELVTSTLYDLGKEKAKHAPTDFINGALKDLQKVDLLQVSKYSDESKKNLQTILNQINEVLRDIEDKIKD